MTSLQELYGDNFRNDFVNHNREYIAGLVVSNIAALNLKEVKHDFSVLFAEDGTELTPEWFQYIKTRIEKMNPFLTIDRITDTNAIPRLIEEEKITYLRIIDIHRKKIYLIFITPYIMDCF